MGPWTADWVGSPEGGADESDSCQVGLPEPDQTSHEYGNRSVKTLLARHASLGVFNNSRENKQCRLEEIPEQNNAGGILSRIVRRAANLSGFIAYGVESQKEHFTGQFFPCTRDAYTRLLHRLQMSNHGNANLLIGTFNLANREIGVRAPVKAIE